MDKDLKTDIAVIRQQITALKEAFDESRRDTKALLQSYDERIGVVEVTLSSQRERVSNLSLFQTGLTILGTAIATYLGINSK